ncbi:MAG: SIR2 family protein [Planctomycetota bacterium]
MELEPTLKVALALHNSPGVYALLLGSGVSTAAGIPTGWQVVLDLVERLARAQGEDPGDDPIAWYAENYGEEPDYSKLLDALTSTQAERSALLRSYFEPTDEEREEGLKVPTAAHEAVAQLAKLGCVRLIVTTNFDRLTEQALEAEGIQPDVVASVDALKGAMPLTHSKCMVVKLHGDYRDTRIRNTPGELADYPDELNTFLDGALDEFGLIVCGWSGAWDTALRDAILRCPNRRFGTYWLAKGKVGSEAKDIVEHRKAEVIPIESADEFFPKLVQQVETLRELDRPHPLSTEAAVAVVKRYVAEPRHRVRLHDLMHEETERTYAELTSNRFGPRAHETTEDGVRQRITEYDACTDRLMRVAAALAFHDAGDNAALLTRAMERLLHMPMTTGIMTWVELQYYPALLVLYAAGLAALVAEHYAALHALLVAPRYRESPRRPSMPGLERASVYGAFRGDAVKCVPMDGAEERKRPVNDYLCDIRLRSVLQPYIPHDGTYENTFDLFEYLHALVFMDIAGGGWAPLGSYSWRWCGRTAEWEDSPMFEFVQAGLREGEEWPLLKAGLFGGSVQRFEETVEKHQEHLQKVIGQWHI